MVYPSLGVSVFDSLLRAVYCWSPLMKPCRLFCWVWYWAVSSQLQDVYSHMSSWTGSPSSSPTSFSPFCSLFVTIFPGHTACWCSPRYVCVYNTSTCRVPPTSSVPMTHANHKRVLNDTLARLCACERVIQINISIRSVCTGMQSRVVFNANRTGAISFTYLPLSFNTFPKRVSIFLNERLVPYPVAVQIMFI